MLKLLDIDSVISKSIPVTTTEFFIGRSNNFHPDGLFSEKIFGAVESTDRRKTYSYIDLNCKILHPVLYPMISRLEQKIIKAISLSNKYILTPDGELVEDENGPITGITQVINNFNSIKLRTEDKKIRADYIKTINMYNKKNLVFIDKMIVIPPPYRDITIDDLTGEKTINPLNEYYVKIIRMSQQIKAIQGGEVYEVLCNRMMELVLDLHTYLLSKISKKTGLLRQDMLGKRIDFSARAVITGSSTEVRADEMGVPLKILVRIFEPFILHEVLNSGRTDKKKLEDLMISQYGPAVKLNAQSLRKTFLGISKNDEIKPDLYSMLTEIVQRAIHDKIIITKRDPSLHPESVQAFKPVIVDGNTIKLHPIKCGGFNADFDGDQMALYVPITRQAIEEAKEKLIVPFSKDGMNQLTDSYEKDVCIGIYEMTKDTKSTDKPLKIKSDDELKTLHYLTPVLYDGDVTTVGRVIFNKILPKGIGNFNHPINKKLLNAISAKIYNKYGKDIYYSYTHEVTQLAFKYSTIAAPSFSMDDIEIPTHIFEMKKKLSSLPPQQASDLCDKMTKELQIYLEQKMGNLGLLGKAGALKGGYEQARQILVAKGLIQDTDGNILPAISESYADGFNSKDFFLSGSGSRKGIADRVLNTAETGYLSRQLVYALQRVEADPSVYNCKTDKALRLKVTPDIAKRLKDRYLLGRGGLPIKIDNTDDLIGKIIPLKSPLYCRTPKICATCYGELLQRNKTEYVGMLAGQILGERGTQLIMKTFHSGGSVSVNTIDIIKSLTDQLTEKESQYIKENFYQRNNTLHCKHDLNIVINKSDYLNPSKDFQIKENKIKLEYGYFDIIKPFKLPVAIDHKSIMYLNDNQIPNDEQQVIELFFKQDQPLIECPPETSNFLDKVMIIRHLLSGKKPFRSADHFFLKVYNQYGPLSECDLIHIEILVSNLLRDRNNPSYPARLNPNYSAKVVNIKTIPQLESWLSALSFEDPKKAIMTGLVYEREQGETVLERIVNGTL